MLKLPYLKHAPLFFIFGWLAILAGVLTAGWTNTWKVLGVPTMYPPFADMRTVQGSLSSLASGFNPQVENPGDPWNRPMNYPSVWSWIAESLSLQNELNYLIFVFLVVIVFLICCYFLLRKYPSSLLLLLLFSGSTLLAVERGNNDLIIFVLLFVAANSPSIISTTAILSATLLKIYPLLAVLAFLKSLRTTAGMTIGVVLVIMFLWPELSDIRSSTPISWGLSYGSQSILAVAQKFNIAIPNMALTATLLSISLLLTFFRQTKGKLNIPNATNSEELLFLIGSCIYIGTFILASNWDYRLIFLLLCIPFLMKLEVKFLRYGLGMSLIAAMNYLPMHALLGKAGIAVNILSKVFLFIVLTSITLIQLKTIFVNKNLKWDFASRLRFPR